MIIIGLVGMQKSGKGVISNALAPEGWTTISMSDVLREKTLLDNPGLEINRDVMRQKGIEYREKSNNGGYLVDLCFERISQLPPEERERVIIDGIRHPDEIKVILSCCDQSYFWGVIADEDRETDQQVRFCRLADNPDQRGPNFESTEWVDFQKADALEWDNTESEYGTKIGKCLEEVSLMRATGRGRIVINGEDKKLEILGEEVREYARELERNSGGPEKEK